MEALSRDMFIIISDKQHPWPCSVFPDSFFIILSLKHPLLLLSKLLQDLAHTQLGHRSDERLAWRRMHSATQRF